MSVKWKKFLYVLLILGGLAAALPLVLLPGKTIGGERKENVPYSGALLRYDGWAVLRESGAPRRVSLPAYAEPEGDSARVVNALPRALESGDCLAFESTNALVSVSVDGEEIYANRSEAGEQPPAMWNFVLLDAGMAEGEITVTFSGPDRYFAGILPEFFLGPRAEIMLLAESETQINTQISVSIVFFGLFIILCALVTFSDMSFSADFILLGLFISALGLSQWLQIVHPTGGADVWFTRQGIGRSIFGLLPPFYCYYCAGRNIASAKKIYEGAFWAGIGLYFLVYVLRWFGAPGTWHALRAVTYAVFEGIYGVCLYCTVALEKESSRRYRFLIGAGLAALMLGIGLENYTHIGYTAMRTARPVILGALAFSLLHAAAVLLYVYSHIEQQARLARELSDSRVRLMMNQLKPHFIRNSLATIRVITRHDPQKAYDLLYDFTRYLSYNIDCMQGTELTTFAEELGHIREYTNIEQEHMGERLKLVYDIGPTDFAIPPLSVEPYVENAVKHGVWQRREGGTVRVSSAETDSAWVITVADDGVGFDPADPPAPAVRGHGIGMKYAAERIRTMAGGSVRVESQPDRGTTVTIEIPKGETA